MAFGSTSNGAGPPTTATRTKESARLRTAVTLGLIGLGFGLAGCETHSAAAAYEPLPASDARSVTLQPCEDRTGLLIERDLAGEASAALAKAIRESDVFSMAPDAGLRLSCDVEGFIAGSALKRWLVPGWGTTKGSLRVAIWRGDGADERIVAAFESRGEVSSGGLYTVGADDYILGVAARDIVRQMEAWAAAA